jgi:hypothetical protein
MAPRAMRATLTPGIFVRPETSFREAMRGVAPNPGAQHHTHCEWQPLSGVTVRTITSPCSKPTARPCDRAGNAIPLEDSAMKMRILFLSMFCLSNAAAMAARADFVDFKVDDTAIGTVEVRGPGEAAYNEVVTKTLDYAIWAKGNPQPTSGDTTWKVTFATQQAIGQDRKEFKGELHETWRKYQITQMYLDTPLHLNGANYMAPIRRCNNVLNRLTGAARDELLFKGTTINLDYAYSVHTWVHNLNGQQLHMGTVWVPVSIKCLPLSKNPFRTTLRIEPAKIQQVGKFLCPMELKLYGHVESHRKFDGQSIFVGPHYLSALTPLSLKTEGSRTVNATYRINWSKTGGFTTEGNGAPKRQKLTFKFNIADKTGKLLQSTNDTVDVSCREIKTAVPKSTGGVKLDPSN